MASKKKSPAEQPILDSSAWIDGFLAAHATRCCLHGFPEPGSESWEFFRSPWVRAFNERAVTTKEADLASEIVASRPPQYDSQHLQAVITQIERIRSNANPQALRKEAAEKASLDCRFCDGVGLAVVFHPEYQGNPEIITQGPDGQMRRTKGRAAVPCKCAFGRWIANCWRNTMKDCPKDLITLDDVLEGFSGWLADDPHYERSRT